jgi:predicted nucleic acid-binding Zn ribbon protein
MPIYLYKCQRCGKSEERFYASFKAMCLEPSVRCIDDGARMERVASAPAFTVGGYNAKNGYSGDKS